MEQPIEQVEQLPRQGAEEVDDVNAWHRLAAAIVEQAVWDYRTVIERGGLRAMRVAARSHATKNTGRCSGIDDAESAVRFFETQAFHALCGFVRVEPKGIVDKLRREGSID